MERSKVWVICDHYKQCTSLSGCTGQHPSIRNIFYLWKDAQCYNSPTGYANHTKLSKLQVIMWNKINKKKIETKKG